MRFNTAISALMVFINEAMTWETKPVSVLRDILDIAPALRAASGGRTVGASSSTFNATFNIQSCLRAVAKIRSGAARGKRNRNSGAGERQVPRRDQGAGERRQRDDRSRRQSLGEGPVVHRRQDHQESHRRAEETGEPDCGLKLILATDETRIEHGFLKNSGVNVNAR